MNYLQINLYLFFGFLGLTAINANVIAQKPVDCECFNSTANANNQDVCRDNVVRCANADSDRPAACFVLWATDNLTGIVLSFALFCFVLNFSNNYCGFFFLSLKGETHVKMKGCFLDNACTNTECIDTSKTKKMNFCCCTGHMCNSKYKLIPTTTKPPKLEENSMY